MIKEFLRINIKSNYRQYFNVTEKTLRAFLKQPVRRRPHAFYAWILLALCEYCGQPPTIVQGRLSTSDLMVSNPKTHAALAEMLALGKRLEHHVSAAADNRAAEPGGDAAGDSEGLAATAASVRQLLGLLRLRQHNDSARPVIEQFFTRSEASSDAVSEVHFETFRYDVRPGMLHKAFLVIFKPMHKGLPCTFAHFHEHRGRTREVRGMILSFRNVLAFWGAFTNGLQAEMMIVHNHAESYTNFDGLILTTSDRSRVAGSAHCAYPLGCDEPSQCGHRHHAGGPDTRQRPDGGSGLAQPHP